MRFKLELRNTKDKRIALLIAEVERLEHRVNDLKLSRAWWKKKANGYYERLAEAGLVKPVELQSVNQPMPKCDYEGCEKQATHLHYSIDGSWCFCKKHDAGRVR